MAYHINISTFTGLEPVPLFTFTQRRIVDLTDNRDFPIMDPTLKTMSDNNLALSLAEAVYSKKRDDPSKLAMEAALKIVVDGHRAWVRIIEDTAGDNLAAFKSTGYELMVEATETVRPGGITPTPTQQATQYLGQVRLTVEAYKPHDPRIFYNWYKSEDGKTFTLMNRLKGGSRVTVDGLELDKKYWFCVAYANLAGEAILSAPVEVTLLSSSVTKGYKPRKKKAAAKIVSGTPAPAPRAGTKTAARPVVGA